MPRIGENTAAPVTCQDVAFGWSRTPRGRAVDRFSGEIYHDDLRWHVTAKLAVASVAGVVKGGNDF